MDYSLFQASNHLDDVFKIMFHSSNSKTSHSTSSSIHSIISFLDILFKSLIFILHHTHIPISIHNPDRSILLNSFFHLPQATDRTQLIRSCFAAVSTQWSHSSSPSSNASHAFNCIFHPLPSVWTFSLSITWRLMALRFFLKTFSLTSHGSKPLG